jgi:hypothetical protein
MADEAAEFWAKFESETGEKVEARSMGEWFKRGGAERGFWGLLILTDKSFRFKYMPSENWIMSIFKRATKSAGSDKPVDIVVPRSDIAQIIAPKRDFLARIFGPAFPRFSVVVGGEAEEKVYSFSVDPTSGLVAALEKVKVAAAGQGAR